MRTALLLALAALLAPPLRAQTARELTTPAFYGGDGKDRIKATFYLPNQAVADSTGRIYVADGLDCVVRVISSTGAVSTLAGSPGDCFEQDGTGSAARFDLVRALALDEARGFLYVAGTNIRRVTVATGQVATVGSSAGINNRALALDPTGTLLYIGNSGEVDVMVLAGSTALRIAGAGFLNTGNVDGSSATARFADIYGLALDTAGANLYLTDFANGFVPSCKVKRLVLASSVTATLAGGSCGSDADGTGNAADFVAPYGIALDSAGANLYVADSQFTNPSGTVTHGHTLRRLVIASSAVTTVAGLSTVRGEDDGAAARFNQPRGLSRIPGTGDVLIADAVNGKVRRYHVAGSSVSTAAGYSPQDPGSLSDALFVGNPTSSNPGEPSLAFARDAASNVYVADGGAHLVRMVSSTGAVTTLAGLAHVAGFADGTGAAARFNTPSGIAVDPAGTTVYVADRLNQRVRRIDVASKAVATVAGSGTNSSADGAGAGASFRGPKALALDRGGSVLYVAEDLAVRSVVLASSQVVTVAGSGGTSGTADGAGAAARFRKLYNMALSTSGAALYLVDRDANANAVRSLVLASSQVATPFVDASFSRVSFLGVAIDTLGANAYLTATSVCSGNCTDFSLYQLRLGTGKVKANTVSLPVPARVSLGVFELGVDTTPVYGLLGASGPAPFNALVRIGALPANAAPNQPTLSSPADAATIGTSTATFKWTASDPDPAPLCALHYVVELATRPDFTPRTVYDSSVSSAGFTGSLFSGAIPDGDNFNCPNGAFTAQFTASASSPLPAGLTYWRVRSWDGQDYSPYSNGRTLNVVPPPGAPTAFAGAAQSTGSILWTWTDNSSNETGFKVLSTTGALAQVSPSLPADTTAWAQGGLLANTSYQNYVQAFNAVGTSSSAAAARFTSAFPSSGTAVANVQFSSLSVSWALNGNPAATVFYLERSTDNSSYAQVSSGAVASYADSGLFDNTTYFYRVRAANGDGVLTAYDGPVSTRTRSSGDATAPAAVTNLAAARGGPSGTVVLTWTAPADPDNNPLTGQYAIQASTYAAAFATADATVLIATSAVVPGAAQGVTLTNLILGATYFVRLFAADSVPNWSPVSNGATAQASLGGIVSAAVPAWNAPYGRFNPMARDSAGNLYAAYVRFTGLTGSTQVFVSRSADAGLTWADIGAGPIAPANGYEQANPVLAIDGANILYALWEGKDAAFPGDTQIRWARYSGAAWSAPGNVSSDAGYAQNSPSVAVDGANAVHAVWRGTTPGDPTAPQVRYAKYSAGAWSAPVVVSEVANYAQGEPSLALDPAGNAHVVWYGGDAGNATNAQVKYSKLAAGVWSAWVNIAPIANGIEAHPAAAVDAAANVHVLWSGADPGNAGPNWQIKYASFTAAAGSWAAWSNIAPTSGFAELFPTLAIDAGGALNALWQGSDTASPSVTQIKYARRVGGVWSAFSNKTLDPAANQQWPALRWAQFDQNGGPLSWLWRDQGGPYIRADPDDGVPMGPGTPSVARGASVAAGRASVLSVAAPGGAWSATVSVPDGAFPVGTALSVDAGAALPAPPPGAGWSPAGSGLAVSAGGLQPARPIALELDAAPGRLAARAGEAELQLARWDPAAGWLPLPTRRDGARGTLRAETDHLSLFGLFARVSASGLGSVVVFPVPWKPGSGGPYDSPAGRAGPVFGNLPSEAVISIYAIDGALVRRLSHAGGALEPWDGNNAAGRPVASGVYVAVIESGGDAVKKRVVVIR